MHASKLRTKCLTIAFAVALAGLVAGPATQPVLAAGECYWSGLQDESDAENAAATWVMRAKWYYGYNCVGQIISMRVTYLRVSISFYNGGDYVPGVRHRILVSQLWDHPANPARPPVWEDKTGYWCDGGCVLAHTWFPNKTWGMSNYTGTGKGFYDAFFHVTCWSCSPYGGNVFVQGNYNFPRDTNISWTMSPEE